MTSWIPILCRFCKLKISTYIFVIWIPEPTKNQYIKPLDECITLSPTSVVTSADTSITSVMSVTSSVTSFLKLKNKKIEKVLH